MLRSLAIVGLIALVVTAPSAADAKRRKAGKTKKAPPATAVERFDRMGKKAYREKRWDDAIAAFEAAWKEDQQPRFLYNLGRAYDKKGDLATAIRHLEGYVEAAPDAQDVDEVRALIEIIGIRLRKTSAPLEVKTVPTLALAVVRDSQGKTAASDETPLKVWLPFGNYAVEINREGYRMVSREVVVRPDSAAEIDVTLVSAKEPAVAKAPPPGEAAKKDPPAQAKKAPPPPPPPPPPPERSIGWPVWAAWGGAGALLAGGAVFGVMSSGAQSARDDLADGARTSGDVVPYPDLRDKDEAAYRYATVANVMYGAAVVAAAAGGALYLFGGDAAAGTPSTSAAVGVQPTLGGLAIGGSF